MYWIQELNNYTFAHFKERKEMTPKENFQHLFSKGRIGSLELKNRLVMAPMGSRLCGLWGEVTDDLIEWYVARARGGVSLVICECTHTATALDPVNLTTRGLRADDFTFIPGLSHLAEAIHDAGSKAGIQLTAGFGAQAPGRPRALGQEGIQDAVPVGPSTIPSPFVQAAPRELSIDEIHKIVELFARGAERIKIAGFDLIDIHAHQGYLIGEFISPYFNKRKDRYGGRLENRLRFLLEIIESVRMKVGKDFPLTIRFSIDEYIEGGLKLEEGLIIAKILDQAGIDAIHTSCGIYGARQPTTAPMYFPEGYLVPLAEAVKKVVSIPVIVSGGLGNPDFAEDILSRKKADFIALGRPLIADPNLPIKAKQGRTQEIRNCIRCNTCREEAHRGRIIRCTVNAIAGREKKYGKIQPADKSKKIVIIGAGPAGMEAARVASLKGHRVKLYEKSNEMGGQIKMASIPPYKDVLRSIIRYYEVVFKKNSNLNLTFGKSITANDINKDEPDVILIATGGTPLRPNIPGIEQDNVVTASDVLTGQAKLGDDIIIAGGGCIGCETANFLARQGKKIIVLEKMQNAGVDIERWTWIALKRELDKADVKILTKAEIAGISGRQVRVDNDGKIRIYEADNVVLALGMKSENGILSKELEFYRENVQLIGDAKQPRNIRNAIADGFIAAYNL